MKQPVRRRLAIGTGILVGIAVTLWLHAPGQAHLRAPGRMNTGHETLACDACLSERDRDPPGAKPTYNLTLRRQVTSCKTAKKVMYAFHKCRSKTRYTCTKRLLSHWRCTGKRESSIPTQFNANFTCKWGTRRVRSSYQQYT